MGSSEQSLRTLGKRVAALQDEAPEARPAHELERGRARLLAADRAGASWASGGARPLTRRLAGSLLVAAAAALLAALVVALVARSREPLRFALGTTEPGVAGAWIAAPPAAELPIRFSDGSLLRLAPGGRARVASVGADGAEVALERGALDLSVVHRDGARWTVMVGPFQIHVIGTRFETRWDPVTEELEVGLREGAITVSGPVVGDARAVRAGERLVISAAKSTLESGSIDDARRPSPEVPRAAPIRPSASPTARAASEDDGDALPGKPGSVPRSSDAVPAAPGVARSAVGLVAPPPAQREAAGWRALAKAARYKEALGAAELEGFDAICDAASAGDLRALGDAARLGGGPRRASQAFLALRRRFAGSPEAAVAAFLLGRIAQDQSRDPAGAAAWFTRYLGEQPGGELAAEAAGRLVEAKDKMGDEAGARSAAQGYLEHYPNGAHAAYARGVMARGAPAAAGSAADPRP
jgi:TolA-binding protein